MGTGNDIPSRAGNLWLGISGGMLAGSVVGISEAAYILSSTLPSEYQAVRYGAVLYGAIGAGLGGGVGLALLVLSLFWKPKAAIGWAISFFGTFSALGFFITRYVMNKAVYLEQGVPMTTTLGIAAGFGALSVIGIALCSVLLSRTPLKVLPNLKGTAAAWAGLVGLATVFSFAPAPGAQGNMAPNPTQDASYKEKPDVVIIMVDTLRADALGVYGAGPTASPRLDAFAKDAVVFDQYITSAAWTRASTASLFTSLSPSSHACETKDAALPDMVDTLAEAVKRGGYVTGGLPNNANVTAALGFGQGYDWFPYEPEYPMGASESTYALSMYAAVRKVWARFNTQKRVEDYYMPAETQFARAQRFIDAQKDKRYLLYVHLMEPHDPYFVHPINGEAYGRAEMPNPPPEMKDKLRGLYGGEVIHADQEIGKFLDWLKASGRYDNTMILVMADHGEEFLEHGGWWHGSTLYDEQIHVPLLVKLPQQAHAGARVPWQVRQIDVAPTITDALGFAPGTGWQGVPLFDDRFESDLALSNPPPPPEPLPVEGQPGEGGAPLAPPPAWTPPTWANHPASREALSEQDFEGYDLQSLRTEGKKLIQATRVPNGNPRNQPPQALYDLQADPTEQTNMGGQGSPAEAAMAARLEKVVEEKKASAVQAQGAKVSKADCERLKALGYLAADAPCE